MHASPHAKLAGLLCLLALPFVIAAPANAQQFLYGHQNSGSIIIKIDTLTGLGTPVGPTGFPNSASALASPTAPVPGPGPTVYASGTTFGLLSDATGDWVVVIDTQTGLATRVVATSRPVAGRGIAFGPDGSTLFLMEPNATLSTINTVTGVVTTVGTVTDGTRNFGSVSLEYDPPSGMFYCNNGSTLIKVNPVTAAATVVGSIGSLGISPCTIVRSPTGMWFTVDNGALWTVDAVNGTAAMVPGSMGLSNICGTAFAPEQPVTLVGDLDIKPSSCPNPLNTKSNGVLPVALLGTPTFDPSQVDLSTVTLEGVDPLRYALEDAATPVAHPMSPCECNELGGDGFDDLTFKFRTQEIVAALGAVVDGEYKELTLSGQLLDGTDFIAKDCVWIIHKVPSGPPVKKIQLTVSRPEPVSRMIRIEYAVPEPTRISLTVIDVAGRVVEKLRAESVDGGQYQLNWNTAHLPSGMYFVRLAGGDQKVVQRVNLHH